LGYSARRHALNDHIASADLGIAAEIGEGESASVAERPVFDLGGARPERFCSAMDVVASYVRSRRDGRR